MPGSSDWSMRKPWGEKGMKEVVRTDEFTLGHAEQGVSAENPGGTASLGAGTMKVGKQR